MKSLSVSSYERTFKWGKNVWNCISQRKRIELRISATVNRKHFCLIWNCVHRLKARMEMEKIGTHAVAFAIGIAVGYYYKKWKDENWHRRWVRQILVQRRSRLAQELLKILNAAEGKVVIVFYFCDRSLSIFYSAPFLSHVVYLFRFKDLPKPLHIRVR